MKRFSLLIILTLLIFTLASCDKNETVPPYNEDNYTDLHPEVSSAVSDNSADSVAVLTDGVTCEYNTFYEFTAETDSQYTFTIVKDSSKAVDNLEWYIYILDERFENGMRYLYESNNPDLTATYETPATATVGVGQYVYCFCSYNAYTETSDIEAGAHLEITAGGVDQ